MRIPTVFCGTDLREMRCVRSGAVVETITGVEGIPYYKISVDIYECEYCHAQSIIPAKAPILEAYQEGYDRVNLSYVGESQLRLTFIN